MKADPPEPFTPAMILLRFIISVLLLLLFVGAVVNAEQISLKNGDRLTGTRYTQEEADQICSEFHGYLTADKVKLVVPPMQHLVDALPNVRHKGEHVDMSTIGDDILQQLKTINLGVRNAPTDEEIAEHLMTHDPKDLTP